MNNFKQDDGFNNRQSSNRFNNRPGGGRFDRRGPRPTGGDFQRNKGFGASKFPAVCAQCNKDCEVPFKPTSGRPVYCDQCFGQQDGQHSERPRNRESSSHNFREKNFSPAPVSNNQAVSSEQFNKLNQKIDKILEILQANNIKVSQEENNREKTSKIVENSIVKTEDKKKSSPLVGDSKIARPEKSIKKLNSKTSKNSKPVVKKSLTKKSSSKKSNKK